MYLWMWTTGLIFFLFTFVEQNLWLLPAIRSSYLRDLTVQWKSNGSMVGAWNQLIYGASLYLAVRVSGNETLARSGKAHTFWFLGLANLLPATADAAGVTVLGARVAADTRGLAGASTVRVRPERVQLVAPSSGQLQGRVQHVVFAGAATHVHMRVGDHDLQAVVPNDGSALAAVGGGDVGLVPAADALRVLGDWALPPPPHPRGGASR